MSRRPYLKLWQLVPPVRFVVCRTGQKFKLDEERRIFDDATGKDWSSFHGATKVKPIIRIGVPA